MSSLPTRAALGFALTGAAAILISTVNSPALLDLAVLSGYYLLLAASWNLLAGFTGEYSFAHAGLATAGAYATVLLEVVYGISAQAAVPLAASATALVGVVLGAVSLRVRGIYLALVTFAFSGAFVVFVTGAHDLTGGSSGHSAEFMFNGSDLTPYAWVMLGAVVLYFACQSLILQSRLGLETRATAEGEAVAEGLGVRTKRVKMLMFIYTAFWAGGAGSLLAGYLGLVSPSMGDFDTMGLIIAITVIGGFGRQFGPIAGVLVVQVISYNARGLGGEYTMLVFASLLLLILVFARDGLLGLAERATRRLRPAHARWGSVR